MKAVRSCAPRANACVDKRLLDSGQRAQLRRVGSPSVLAACRGWCGVLQTGLVGWSEAIQE